jgi:hypothetical protein
MKIQSVQKLNALGFQNSCQRALYAAIQLLGGTNPSPAKIIVPAIAAIRANPTATPPIVAVAAVPAITSPAVTPDPRFIGSVVITEMAEYIKIEANLPYTPAVVAKGKDITIASIDQCSPAALDLGDWLGLPASEMTSTESLTGITTIEQFLYRESINAFAEIQANPNPNLPASSIERALYQPTNLALPKIPVIKILLHLPRISSESYLGSVAAGGSNSQIGELSVV